MTTSHTPFDVAKAFLKAMEPLDFDTALKHVAANCEYTNPPPFGTVHGSMGMRAVLEPFFSPTLENEFTVLRAAVNGHVVILERLDRHRLADKWVELPVTGVFEVHDGKITYWRDYFDVPTLMAQWPTA